MVNYMAYIASHLRNRWRKINNEIIDIDKAVFFYCSILLVKSNPNKRKVESERNNLPGINK